jgi:hypothetical protein
MPRRPTKLSDARTAVEAELRKMNGDTPLPALSKGTKWVQCDLCSRNPISAWHFKPALHPEMDVCFPCYKAGKAAHLGPLLFMGWAPRLPKKHAGLDDLAETSSDEERGVSNPKSLHLAAAKETRAHAKPAVKQGGKATSPKKKPMALAKPEKQAAKSVAKKSPVKTSKAKTVKAAPKKASPKKAVSKKAISKKANVARPAAPSRKRLTEAVNVGKKKNARKSTTRASASSGASSSGSSSDGSSSSSDSSSDSSESDDSDDDESAAVQTATPKREPQSKAAFAAGGAAVMADLAALASQRQVAAEVDDSTAPDISNGIDGDNHVDDAAAVDVPKRAAPNRGRPKGVKKPPVADDDHEEQSNGAGHKRPRPKPAGKRAKPQPPATAPVTHGESEEQQQSPPPQPRPRDEIASPVGPSSGSLTQGSGAPSRLPIPREPAGIEETSVVKFFRGFNTAPQPAPPMDPHDAMSTLTVGDEVLEPGQVATVTTGELTHYVALCHGEVISVRIAPTLSSEGVWFSVLIKGNRSYFAAIWHMPLVRVEADGQATAGKPQLRGILHAGHDVVLGMEWLPTPIHDDSVLGFATLLKPNLLMNGVIPKDFAETKVCSTRVCGLTQFTHKELDPVAMRWVCGGPEVEQAFLVVIHRCSTVLIFHVVRRLSTKMLVLSPRNRFPAPRSVVPLPLSAPPPPMAVGTRSNSVEPFVAVAHGTVMTIIEGGSQLASVTQVASQITALAATSRGVYCSMANGQTAYVRLSGRESTISQLDVEDTPVGAYARATDVLIASSKGIISRWAPPAPLSDDWQMVVTAGRAEILSAPSRQAAAVSAGTFRYAFHPIDNSPLVRYCVVQAAPNVVAVADVPMAPVASGAMA